MAIDKTIRIQDLPASDFLNNDNLFVINDSDNITRNITFENFIGSITELPGGINIPPTEPGRPGINFCPEDNLDCGTGIGSGGDCNIFISSCGVNIIEINGSGVGINGDLEIDGDLIVNKDAYFKGDVNIGSDCLSGFDFIVNLPTTINCEANILGDIVLGTNCLNSLLIQSSADFRCDTVFNGDVNITPGNDLIIEGGDIIINGNIKPPNGGNLDLHVDNIIIDGNATIGDPSLQCAKSLDIYNETTVHCEMTTEKNVYAESDIYVGEDVNGDPLITLEASTGDITARYFRGDGSTLVNLNIPDSMRFKGTIDVSEPPPANPVVGDFYININDEGVDAGFNGFESNVTIVEKNRIVYYVVIENVGQWGLGSQMDITGEGFVTITTEQIVTGNKDFTGVVNVPLPLVTEHFRAVNVRYVKNATDQLYQDIINDVTDDFVTLNTEQTVNNSIPITGEKSFTAKVEYTPVVDGSDLKEVVNVEYLSNKIDELSDEVNGNFVTLDTVQDGRTGPAITARKKFTENITIDGTTSDARFELGANTYATYQPVVTGVDDKEMVNVEYVDLAISRAISGGGNNFPNYWNFTLVEVGEIPSDTLFPDPLLSNEKVNVYTPGVIKADTGVLFYNNEDIMNVTSP